MSEFIRYATSEEIEADLGREPTPPSFNTEPVLPFDRMGDRSFECLLHDIAMLPERSVDKRFGTYEKALLMQGVGERGRDCALIRRGSHVGAVQCKRYQDLITKPDAAREIIKYCLHAIKDPELMPDPSDFTYVFATSRDFNEKAKLLLSEFGECIGKEPELPTWTAEVIGNYKGLAQLKIEVVMPRLKVMLEAITVVPIGFNELETLLTGEAKIIQKYFAVRTVVDNEPLDVIGKKVDAVYHSLGDPDTRRLIDDLNAQPKDRRLDFGHFSLWGYPSRMLNEIVTNGTLKQIGFALAKAKAELDDVFLTQFKSWVDGEIQANVTRLGFSPLVISAAAPHLLGRLLERWRRIQQGTLLSSILPQPNIKTDILAIRRHLLDLGEAYLRDDWSGYVGEGELLALKKQLVRHIYNPYPDVSAMEQQFDREWPFLHPVLDQIEVRLEAEIPTDTIVVLRSMQWFGDPDHLKSVLQGIATRERGNGDPIS